MSDRKALYEGMTSAAWGYIFLNLDINLGTVSILPRFVGWLLLRSALPPLSEERRDLALLRPLCTLLAAWTAGDWALSWVGGDLDGKILFLDLLTAAAALYFHFQFLTDMAALAESYQAEEDGLDGKFRYWRTVQTVLVTGMALAAYLPAELLGSWREGMILLLGVITCVASLILVNRLFLLRGLFRE